MHEKVETTQKIARLQHVILHYSYRNIEHYVEKLNIYTTLGAKNLHSKKKSRHPILSILSFPYYFFNHYIIRGNIWNGKAGFVWSWLNACYHVVKYLKLDELNDNL